MMEITLSTVEKEVTMEVGAEMMIVVEMGEAIVKVVVVEVVVVEEEVVVVEVEVVEEVVVDEVMVGEEVVIVVVVGDSHYPALNNLPLQTDLFTLNFKLQKKCEIR